MPPDSSLQDVGGWVPSEPGWQVPRGLHDFFFLAHGDVLLVLAACGFYNGDNLTSKPAVESSDARASEHCEAFEDGNKYAWHAGNMVGLFLEPLHIANNSPERFPLRCGLLVVVAWHGSWTDRPRGQGLSTAPAETSHQG
jgi:hypothetical protein